MANGEPATAERLITVLAPIRDDDPIRLRGKDGRMHRLVSDDGVTWTRCEQHGEADALLTRLAPDRVPSCQRGRWQRTGLAIRLGWPVAWRDRRLGEVASDRATPGPVLVELAADELGWVRRSVAENRSTPPDVLTQLARDANENVREAVAYNRLTPPKVLTQLAGDARERVRWGVAKHRATRAEVLDRLAGDVSFVVRAGVAAHPTAPAGALTRLAEDEDELVRTLVADNLAHRTTVTNAESLGID